MFSHVGFLPSLGLFVTCVVLPTYTFLGWVGLFPLPAHTHTAFTHVSCVPVPFPCHHYLLPTACPYHTPSCTYLDACIPAMCGTPTTLSSSANSAILVSCLFLNVLPLFPSFYVLPLGVLLRRLSSYTPACLPTYLSCTFLPVLQCSTTLFPTTHLTHSGVLPTTTLGPLALTSCPYLPACHHTTWDTTTIPSCSLFTVALHRCLPPAIPHTYTFAVPPMHATTATHWTSAFHPATTLVYLPLYTLPAHTIHLWDIHFIHTPLPTCHHTCCHARSYFLCSAHTFHLCWVCHTGLHNGGCCVPVVPSTATYLPHLPTPLHTPLPPYRSDRRSLHHIYRNTTGLSSAMPTAAYTFFLPIRYHCHTTHTTTCVRFC